MHDSTVARGQITNGWLMHALGTVLLWGVWGAIIGLPTERGVPDTINYVVWSLTMIPVAVIALSPAVTIAMSFALLRERTGRLGMLGIGLALLSLPLFDYRVTGDPIGY